VLASVEGGPSDSSWVLALEEKRLALAVLETEDLGVTTDVELALFSRHQQLLSFPVFLPCPRRVPVVCSVSVGVAAVLRRGTRGKRVEQDGGEKTHLARVDLRAGERIVVGTHVDGGCGG